MTLVSFGQHWTCLVKELTEISQTRLKTVEKLKRDAGKARREDLNVFYWGKLAAA